VGEYDLLCRLARLRGWRVCLHLNEDPEPGEDLRLLAIWDRSPNDEFAELLEAMVVVDAPDGLDFAAGCVVKGLARAGYEVQ
jgi:hypothetical protein